MYRRVPPSRWIPKGSTKVTARNCDAVAYVFNNARGRPAACVYFGKQSKPVFHYSYRNEEERARSIATMFKNRAEAIISTTEYRARRTARNAEARGKIQVGDIYRTCWGYDQTNVEFFEVIEVKGAYATLRQVACASAADGPGSDRVVAQSGQYLQPRFEGDKRGEPLRRLIQDGHIKIDDVRLAWPWGTRVAGVVVGEAVHSTAFGWGH